MTYSRKNRGVCSGTTTVSLTQDGIIEKVEVSDGCDGNLQAVCNLLQGQSARKVIPQLSCIRCEDKRTSCPAQIALCLQEALEQQ